MGNDERYYPDTSNRLVSALAEAVDDEVQEKEALESIGDDLAKAAADVLSSWYDDEAIVASEMNELAKQVATWEDWRRYGGE